MVVALNVRRRIVREDWYWPTIRKIAENRFRKGETKADLLLELDLKAKACCAFFGKDQFACRDCFKLIPERISRR